MSVCKQTVWVLPLGWPLTLLWPLRSGEWDHITLCLALCVGIYSLAKLVCVIVVPVGEHVCDGEGGGAVCLFLVARETPSACVCCYSCQTMALLLSIQRERGQGGASHHLPTKGQVTQPASAPPSFPSIPPQLTSPHCWASWENWGFLLIFLPPDLFCWFPYLTPQFLDLLLFVFRILIVFKIIISGCALNIKKRSVLKIPVEATWLLSLYASGNLFT